MDFADYSLIPPVDIIPKLYATEYKEKIESKKWSERVEAIKVRELGMAVYENVLRF